MISNIKNPKVLSGSSDGMIPEGCFSVNIVFCFFFCGERAVYIITNEMGTNFSKLRTLD